ncbi:MAG: hypothetical protein L6V81_07270 [Clostridium sp.]|nr:MAG: hypothetical protein L6V81_07270 [Clostridium sp.]
MLFIVAAYFLNHIFGEILVEVFTVFGWVALWEVAYAIFFTDASRRRNIKKYNQIIKSKKLSLSNLKLFLNHVNFIKK